MKSRISPQAIASGIIIFAIVLFVGAISYEWYITSSSTFIAGEPPQELMTHITPKQVPYDQIKPPAITPTDIFLYGSASSSKGIVFYGDFLDPASNKLIVDLQQYLTTSKEDVRLVWHYLPASSEDGQASFEAALFNECARLFDPELPAFDYLVRSDAPQKITRSDLRKFAVNTSVQAEIIQFCQESDEVRTSVRTAIQQARGDGIDMAPFIFAGTTAIPASQATLDHIINVLESSL